MIKDFLKNIIQEAGEIGKEYFHRGVTPKIKSHATDYLTEADLAINDFLVGKINNKFPSHHIKSEELADDINVGGEYEWVIDPIDGTWPFVKGIPTWAVMIAVLKNGAPYLAAVYFPIASGLFFAEAGVGSWLNDKKIRVNSASVLERNTAIMHRSVAGGPYGTHFERYRNFYTKVVLETNISVVNFASAASLCYVASGAIDFAIGNAGLDWDLLPTTLICQEAGATVTDSDGNPWQRGRQDYFIANPELHDKLLDFLKQY